MGKGDRKTRKGKIFRGSYGNTRPHGGKNAAPAPTSEKKKSTAKKKKPTAKKSS